MDIPQGRMAAGDLVIDGISVSRAGKPIHVSPREFWLLVYLVKNQNRVVTRRMIEEHSWGTSYEGLTNSVDVYINYLRNKIDKPFPAKLMHTVRGFGYMLSTQEVAESVQAL